MTTDQFKGKNWWDIMDILQKAQETDHADDADWANDVAHSIINGMRNNDLDDRLAWANADGALESLLFPEGSEPVTVTKTTTSVGGLPPSDIGGTPEEAEAMANNMLGEQPVENHDDGYGGLADGIMSAQTEDELKDILKSAGITLPEGEEGIEAPKDTDPGSDAGLDKLDKKEDKPADKPAEDKPVEEKKEEPKADKPAEEPKKEDKPAEKPAEDKSESKKEDKQEQSDTDRNIISTLSDLK